MGGFCTVEPWGYSKEAFVHVFMYSCNDMDGMGWDGDGMDRWDGMGIRI